MTVPRGSRRVAPSSVAPPSPPTGVESSGLTDAASTAALWAVWGTATRVPSAWTTSGTTRSAGTSAGQYTP